MTPSSQPSSAPSSSSVAPLRAAQSRSAHWRHWAFKPPALRSLALLLPVLLLATGCLQERNSPNAKRVAQTVAALDAVTLELAYGVGLANRVVAVPRGTLWPPEATSLPKVGSASEPDLRVLRSIAPRYVLLPAGHDASRAALEEEGFQVIEIETQSLGGLRVGIDTLGAALESSGAAEGLRRRLEITLAPRPIAEGRRVVITLGRDAEERDKIRIAREDDWAGELLSRLGAFNPAENLESPFASMQEILELQPEAIIELSTGSLDKGELSAEEHNAAWRSASTEPDQRIPLLYSVTGSHVLIPGPRLPRTYNQLTEVLQGLPIPEPAVAP
ncbi:MAG: ABC transporter substrate-binding protein [Acidobacteriota bacterium]